MKAISSLLLLVLLGAYSHAQVTEDSIVCYFPFNGDPYDYYQNAVIDTVLGAVLTKDRFGRSDNAYFFDGIDDHIAISNFKDINPSDQISFSIWAQALGNTSNCMLMLYPDDNSDRCVTCAQYKGNIYWDYGNISNSGRMSAGIQFDTLWHHYVYQYDGVTEKKEVYMDGMLLKSEDNSTRLSDNDRELWIGGGTDANPGDIRFTGRIDDIRIYNQLLNSEEVVELYNEGKCFETVVIYDTIQVFDTIPVFDSIPIFDTIPILDTALVFDTIQVFDTVRTTIYDSISVADTLIIDAVFTGLDSKTFMNRLQVYPNPARRMIYIDTGAEYEKMSGHTIRVLSSSGSVVYVAAVNKSLMELSVDDLGSPGLYILQIIDSGAKLITSKKILLE